jgi:hypothetical protein
MLAVALGALGGCWWHDSDVPAIEEADRAQRAPLEDGVYCNVSDGATGLALEDCAGLAWDRDQRRIRVTPVEVGEPPVWLDVAPLAGGLVAMQYDETQEEKERGYTLFALVTAREGYVLVPLPSPEVRDAIAAEEGVTVEETDGMGRILAGEPAAVRRVVERSAVAWLASEPPPGVDKLGPEDTNVDDDFFPPHYVVRMEALDDDLEETAAVDKAIERLQAEVERTATRAR